MGGSLPSMRFSAIALLVACAGAPPRPAPADPLADLNRTARAAYADARSRASIHAGPVLIVGPAQIALLQGASRAGFELVPPRYSDLKSIAHLALGLHSVFFEADGDPARLAELRAAAARALDALPARGLTPAQLDRQREIIRLSLAVGSARDLPGYERAVAPLLLANALDAAAAEIADLDAAVEAARHTLGPQEFSRLHVIVVGAHMAREGEIAMQYFEKLLGEREGLRLVFAEGLWDEASELQLLATHLLDASASEGFFGDPRRMHRDLLSDAAAQVLATRR
jgi:hypothetical protein